MGDESAGQHEVEKLLNELQGGAAPTAKADAAAASGKHASASAAEGAISQNDIEHLFRQAEEAIASINEPASAGAPAGVAPFMLSEFQGAAPNTESATLELIRDVELDLRIELGRTHMYLDDVLRLCKGAVVTLDRNAGDPVDIFVNGRLIARGEVLVLNDNFCVRVAELVAGDAAATPA